MVRLVDPADPNIGDPVGVERTFTAACDQPATMTVYLDGTLVHTSASGVQQVSYTVPSAPLGQHMVRVVAANANGTGENYWNWNVVSTPPVITSVLPGSDCLVDTTESFFQRTFEIITDIASKIRVYVNDVLTFAQETYSTVMSWIFDRTTTPVNPDPFVNIIRIVVENTNGTTEKIIYSIITQAPVTSAPVITSASPAEHTITNIAGSPGRRTFGVTVDQPATIIFSVGGREKCRFSAVTDATWECDFSGYSAGIHSVVVTASNSNGSDSFTWSWNILPLVITLEEPAAQNVSNYDTSSRLFRASLNTPARLTMYFDDRPIERPESEVSTILHEFKTVPLGNHTIRVVAEKDGITVEDFWNWSVSEYPPLGAQKVVLCKTFTKATSRTHTDHYHVATHATLITYISEELRFEKCQLPDDSWIYLFHLAVGGSIRDDEGGKPPIVRSAVASHYDDRMYLSDFDIIQIDIKETENKDSQVLFSAFDPFCYGIYPLKDGEIRNISDNAVAYDLVCSVLGALPIPGSAPLSAIFVFSRLCGLFLADTTRIERIYESFAYEEHEDVRATSGVIFGPCDVTNYIRWIVWVNKGHTIRFNLNVKLFENAYDFMEVNEEISIDSSQDPIVL
ncbi:hypothetical protein [Methanoculleus bourgensis]|uniref:hypothetical protein n=1 Tax=Methanoculleus bourgensis TaxID=83986 RepID=UPI002490DC1E|nr:hypothetical protein [Methanoculleus bourgensis]